MNALDTTKTKDKLLAELDVAKATYDSAEVGRLEEEIKKINEKEVEHKVEMAGETQKADKEKTMKMEELTNLLKDKPENAQENAQEIVDQAKTRLQETIDRYINKIKELKNTNADEVTKLKDEVKKEKDTYEKVKKDFFAK
jgi:multidrug efflux pump subunit AcrB